jgi:hypothetical protein
MMNSAWHKPPVFVVLLMWLALPLSWMEYHQNWEQLPARMAVHFDANWHPNGFTSREGALELGLGIMAVMLLIFTVSSFAVRALKPQAGWPALLIAYVAIGFVWYGNHSIVKFNLNSQRVRSEIGGSLLSVSVRRAMSSEHEVTSEELLLGTRGSGLATWSN